MFENFGRKIVAKVHETIETDEAVNVMTGAQSTESRTREMQSEVLEKTGVSVTGKVKRTHEFFQGVDEKGRVVLPSSSKQSYEANIDGKNVQLHFKQISTQETTSQGSKIETSFKDVKCSLDGIEVVGEEENIALLNKYHVALQYAYGLQNPVTIQ